MSPTPVPSDSAGPDDPAGPDHIAIRVHGTLASSRVNGPGDRAVVHLQGCDLGCPACFNPDTHATAGGTLLSAASLAEQLAASAVDGVTISGGEPFQQPGGLAALVTALRERGVDSIMVFTGYSTDELAAMDGAAAILAEIDLLVAGRYDARSATRSPLLSSENQRLHFLSDRHHPGDLEGQEAEVEITIAPDGKVTMTGFPSPGLRRAVREVGSPPDRDRR